MISQRSRVGVGALLAAGALALSSSAAADRFPTDFYLADLLPANGGDGSEGFVLNAAQAGDTAGSSIKYAGDLNNDGTADLIIGAPRADPDGRVDGGRSYVVYGRATGGFPPAFELSSLLPANGGDGSNGFVLNGASAGEGSGRSVSGAGDVNDDGIADLIVGTGVSQSYVVYGRDSTHGDGFPPVVELSALLPANGGNGSAGFALVGVATRDGLGQAVSGAGDLNGDDVDDMIVGAYRATPLTRTEAGVGYLVFGRSGPRAFPPAFPLGSLLPANGGDGSAGAVLTGVRREDHAGWSVSGTGDLNGDGIGELVIGAPDAAWVYILFGRAESDPSPAVVQLSSLLPGQNTTGFAFIGDAVSNGYAVSGVGDVNADGVADVISGEHHSEYCGPGCIDNGTVFLVFGRARTDGFAGTERTIEPDVTIDCAGSYNEMGSSVSAAGDVDGDGIDDLLMGSMGHEAGRLYVMYGRPAAQWRPDYLLNPSRDGASVMHGVGDDDQTGYSVTGAADLNGDGRPDLAVAAPRADSHGEDSGAIYVVYGR